jgi:hypothetical protein
VCVKDKCGKCKGKLKTTLQYEIVSKTDHSCVPNLAVIEVKVEFENCIKRARKDVSVPLHTVYKEELSRHAKGYDMVTEIPKYKSVKSRLCKERRKVLGTEENPEDISKIVFPEEVLRLANNSSFLRIDHTDGSGKRILVFAGEDCEYLLRTGTSFFLDGTIKNCPRQFAQLYSLHVHLGGTSHENYIYPILFALYRIKKKKRIIVVNSVEELVCVLVTKNYKGRF